MGLFSCCLSPTTEEPVLQAVPIQQRSLSVAQQQQDPGLQATIDSAVSPPAAEHRDTDWSKSWSKLNQPETTAVKQTLLKVSELIEQFAEGSAEREAPVHALKKALQLVATDCHASYASMSVVSADQQTFLVMGCGGSSHEATTLPNLVTAVAGSDSSVERLMNHASSSVGSQTDLGGQLPCAGGSSSQALSWSVDDVQPPPGDWLQLQRAGIQHIHAMPIRAGPDQLLGVLNLGFKHEPCLDVGSMGPHLFSSYLSLVSATLTAVVRDPGLSACVCLARDLAAASSLDGMMQAALLGSQRALTRLKGIGSTAGSATCGAHTWLRLALVSGDKSAAVLFDDLSQAGLMRSNKRSSSNLSSSSAQLVATIQAAGGLVRTNIPMKNTILSISLTNKKQVLIPDVQKLINQLGNVNTDLFASRLLRPPSSVLLLPLRASGAGVYGALYCLADVHTEFCEVAKQLKEVAELLGAGLHRQLAGALAAEYTSIQQLSHEQLLARDNTHESGNSLGGLTCSSSHGSGVFPGAITPSTVTPSTTAGSLLTGYSTTTVSSSSVGGATGLRSEGSFTDAAIAGGVLESGSTIGTSSMYGSYCSIGGSFTGVTGLGRSFTSRQVASSTNAVATGITEKLNQKRIDAAMSEAEDEALGALQLVAQIGEGGFAKVFRGLYRGLLVAVKVVAVGDPSNGRAVMKNAHEIAILRSSSHPNIIQAYSCMTDVHIREVVALCTRQAPRQQRAALIAALTTCSASQQRQQQHHNTTGSGAGTGDDATCHIEVVEYCDLGNLTSAIRSQIFNLPFAGIAGSGRCSSHMRHASRGSGCEAGGGYDSSADGEGSCGVGTAASMAGGAGAVLGALVSGGSAVLLGRLRVNMRWLLLTLLEVAEGMAYLHRMGVVHCDLKPANVLLKSSNADLRGFTAKVSDFGLSRVEDDDMCATFPFNSCGTAAYVAPEALITSRKVNASVDIYAFGVMMWELFVGQRPYGNMTQQKVVEEVVLRGLRPCFPAGTPPAYVQLAASCWHATADARPSFQEVIARLQAMLNIEECEAAAAASCSLTGSEAWGGCVDGLGTPQIGGTLAAAAVLASAGWAPGNQRNSNPGGITSPAGPSRPGIPRSRSSSNVNALAAPVTAEAAQQRQQQQQQQQLLQHQNANQQQAATSAAAATAAAGSVYEFQQVGFDSEAVSGTARNGASRLSSGVGNVLAGMMGSGEAQQQWLQAAAAATAGGKGGEVHSQLPPLPVQRQGRRPPTRSKTFTAGSTSQQQQYEQLAAAANAAEAAAASSGTGGGCSGDNGTSTVFGYGPGTEVQQQQQQAAQQVLLQRQQQVMARHGGYNSPAGLLATQQGQLHVQHQQHFAFPVPPGYSNANAAIVMLQQQQQHQQHQFTLKAACELLARQAAAASAVGALGSGQHQQHQLGVDARQQ